METRDNKKILSETLAELAEIVWKNNIFEFDEKTFKQTRGTVIGTKFAPSYAIFYGWSWGKNVGNCFLKVFAD